MKDWFKPLYSYRKYLLAEKILKEASACHVTLTEFGEPRYQKNYMPVIGMYFLKANPKVKPERFYEAVDLLADNKHGIKKDNPDILQVWFTCNVEGERAINDGFYRKKIILFWTAILGIPSIIALLEVLRLLNII